MEIDEMLRLAPQAVRGAIRDIANKKGSSPEMDRALKWIDDLPDDQWDFRKKSFGVRVSPSGHKSYIAFARFDGCLKKMTIGNTEKISLETAWVIAQTFFETRSASKARRLLKNFLLDD